MDNKIPVCCKCGKRCIRGEYADIDVDGEWAGEYLSNCCGVSIIYYDDIKELILKRLEWKTKKI